MRTMTAILLCSAVILSCASRSEIKQFQNDMIVLKSRVESLQMENRKIWELLQEVRRSLADLNELTVRNKADLLAEMSAIREHSENLQMLLDDTGDRMSRLMHNVESARPRPIPADTSGAPADTAGGGGIQPRVLYDAAYLDLSRGDYDLALRGFQEYLMRFPDTEFADNAQYWIGEIHYAKQDYAKAFQEFENVTFAYGSGDKAAAAFLKMAYCLIQSGDTGGASKYLNIVLQRFPDTPEARLARTRLEEL